MTEEELLSLSPFEMLEIANSDISKYDIHHIKHEYRIGDRFYYDSIYVDNHNRSPIRRLITPKLESPNILLNPGDEIVQICMIRKSGPISVTMCHFTYDVLKCIEKIGTIRDRKIDIILE